MRTPGIFTEIRYDTTDTCGVFHAVPDPVAGKFFDLSIPSRDVRLTHADLVCAAEYFTRLAAATATEGAARE